MDAEIRTFDDYLTATAKLLVLADLEIICVENLQTTWLRTHVRRTQHRRHRRFSFVSFARQSQSYRSRFHMY
jgi:hypothetical protein